MEERKRTILAVAIALIVVAALLYSFGLNLFSRTPQLDLADPGQSESMEPGSVAPGQAAGIKVEVEPNTVQNIVASLSRYESYSRVVTVNYYWGDGASGTMTSQVWEDDGWCRIETLLPSGLTECTITGGGSFWLWYDDGSGSPEIAVHEGSAEDRIGDRFQHLPTYEEILSMDTANITAADYVEHDGSPCIYVEAEQRELGYLYRYWVSATNGLLMAAETEKSGVLVYRMESGEVISPLDSDGRRFVLPDGRVLH